MPKGYLEEISHFCSSFLVLGNSRSLELNLQEVVKRKGLARCLTEERIRLPVQETKVCSLSRKDPLEKAMSSHSSILAWEVPWTEEPAGLWSMGSQESQTQLGD